MAEFENVGPKGYVAHIIDKVTGNRGTIEHDMFWYYIDDDGEKRGSEFWWEEGNMGCDCNRAKAFEELPEDSPCTGSAGNRFIVEKIVLSDGEEIHIENYE